MDKPFPKSPAHLWALLEDRLFPAHHVTPYERALLYHLLRHTALRGTRTMLIAKTDLARATAMCPTTVRLSLRSLAHKSLLRILDRGQQGLLLEVTLPPPTGRHSACPERSRGERSEESALPLPSVSSPLESCILNFESPLTHQSAKSAKSADIFSPLTRPTKSRSLRHFIYQRDRRRCFYCLRPLSLKSQISNSPLESGIGNLESPQPLAPSPSPLPLPSFTLDHLTPAALGGDDSVGNLVACCPQCNSLKGEMPAEKFLLWLHQRSYLTCQEYKGRLRALKYLARHRDIREGYNNRLGISP